MQQLAKVFPSSMNEKTVLALRQIMIKFCRHRMTTFTSSENRFILLYMRKIADFHVPFCPQRHDAFRLKHADRPDALPNALMSTLPDEPLS